MTIDTRLPRPGGGDAPPAARASVATWPVDSLALARRLGSCGVSGIITNDLELARTSLLERLERGHELTEIAVG